MKIIVCVKQVPDTTEVRIDKETNTLIREGVPSILNPDDANALEQALQLKDKYDDVTVTVLSMGPPQADVMLRECLAMGADEAVLLTDRAFGGSDTWATSNALAAAIRKIGKYDIILAGRQAIDGDTAQVGPQISEKLDIPQVTYVEGMELEGNKVKVQRQLEDGYEIIEAELPILLTAVKELKILTINDVDIDTTQVGLKASPTRVFRSFTPEVKGGGIILEGSEKEVASKLVGEFKDAHII